MSNTIYGFNSHTVDLTESKRELNPSDRQPLKQNFFSSSISPSSSFANTPRTFNKDDLKAISTPLTKEGIAQHKLEANERFRSIAGRLKIVQSQDALPSSLSEKGEKEKFATYSARSKGDIKSPSSLSSSISNLKHFSEEEESGKGSVPTKTSYHTRNKRYVTYNESRSEMPTAVLSDSTHKRKSVWVNGQKGAVNLKNFSEKEEAKAIGQKLVNNSNMGSGSPTSSESSKSNLNGRSSAGSPTSASSTSSEDIIEEIIYC